MAAKVKRQGNLRAIFPAVIIIALLLFDLIVPPPSPADCFPPGNRQGSCYFSFLCHCLKVGSPATANAGVPDQVDWLDELIDKLWQVESAGSLNPPDGDGGRAAGPLQIHKCVVDDVNRFCRTDFTYSDRYEPAKAKQITRLYITLWLERNREELAARIFNGGPRGWRKTATNSYWAKVKKNDGNLTGPAE